MTDEINIATVIKTYMKLRAKKEALELETKSAVASLKDKMALLEKYLKEQMDAQQVTSYKSEFGTAFITSVDFAQVQDWDAALDFIKTNDQFDMLEKRVSKLAVRAWIDEHKEVPAGINFGTRIEVNIRKPSPKA